MCTNFSQIKTLSTHDIYEQNRNLSKIKYTKCVLLDAFVVAKKLPICEF